MNMGDGFVLKVARLKAGIKQFELAAQLGISPVELCEIETGRRKVTPDMYERISIAIKSGINEDKSL
jgi:transcriptional regulator with XRE-family HTH domain